LRIPDHIGYDASQAAEVELTPSRLTVIWLSAAGCDGCSMAMLGASEPAVEALLYGEVSDLPPITLVHSLLALESGADYRAHLERAAHGDLDPYILVLEGSIMEESLAGEGSFSRLGTQDGRPLTASSWVDRLAPGAAAVIAIGSCATWGGIPAAAGNPTGARGLGEHLGPDFRSADGLPVVNLPGCAPPGEVLIETVVSVAEHLLRRVPLDLDEQNRPRWLYNEVTHPSAPRAEGVTAVEQSIEVCCSVPAHGWMKRIGGCAQVGGACIGCTAPDFVDRLLPLVRLPVTAR
jgi:hydrogenase small subunit